MSSRAPVVTPSSRLLITTGLAPAQTDRDTHKRKHQISDNTCFASRSAAFPSSVMELESSHNWFKVALSSWFETLEADSRNVRACRTRAREHRRSSSVPDISNITFHVIPWRAPFFFAIFCTRRGPILWWCTSKKKLAQFKRTNNLRVGFEFVWCRDWFFLLTVTSEWNEQLVDSTCCYDTHINCSWWYACLSSPASVTPSASHPPRDQTKRHRTTQDTVRDISWVAPFLCEGATEGETAGWRMPSSTTWTAVVLVLPSAFAAGRCSKTDANVQAEVKPTCDAQEFRDALPPVDKNTKDTARSFSHGEVCIRKTPGGERRCAASNHQPHWAKRPRMYKRPHCSAPLSHPGRVAHPASKPKYSMVWGDGVAIPQQPGVQAWRLPLWRPA